MFWRFSRVGLQGFGGVLPLIQREVVERARWIDDGEFAEVMGLAAALPGPNVCNLAVIFGWQQAGVLGAVAALSGLVLGPATLLLIVAQLLQGVSDLGMVRGALDGMSSVAAGLIFASALKMLLALKAQRWLMVFGFVAFAGVVVLHWSLVPVLMVSGVASVGLAWWLMLRQRVAR